MALVGTVPCRFNGRPATTITDFQHGVDRPGQVKAGGYGILGATEGVETGSGSFRVRCRLETGFEFPIDTLRKPFSMAWPHGPNRLVITGCKMTRLDQTVNQQTGDNEWSVSFIYEQLKQTR